MNSFMISTKKFLKNKNTVTVLGVLVILALLYWGYSSAVKKATNPIVIPVAKETIKPYQQITKDDIEYISVSGITVSDNVIRNSNAIINMYTNLNVTIPAGSMFYSEWLVSEEDLPGKWIESVNFKKGEEAYYFNVDTVSTLGNSVVPDSYIDLYMKTTDESGLVMYGKLLENIKVLVVHDDSGKDAFANESAPSYLGFAINQEYYLLLKKAQYLGDSLELVIAPHGTDVGKIGDVAVRSEDLRDYVIAKTAQIDTDALLAKQKEEALTKKTKQTPTE